MTPLRDCEMCEWYNDVLADFRANAGAAVVSALTEAYEIHRHGCHSAEGREIPADTEVYREGAVYPPLMETEVSLDTAPPE